MSDKRIHGTATVEVTLQIPVTGGGWGRECTLEQLYKQAVDNVKHQLHVLIESDLQPNKQPIRDGKWRIIGEPRVRGIVTEED